MKLKSIVQHVKRAATTTQAKVVAGGSLFMASAAAHAQEAAASTAFDSVAEQGTEMAGYAWPVAGAITASLIGIKLFKKFANRAS